MLAFSVHLWFIYRIYYYSTKPFTILKTEIFLNYRIALNFIEHYNNYIGRLHNR